MPQSQKNIAEEAKNIRRVINNLPKDISGLRKPIPYSGREIYFPFKPELFRGNNPTCGISGYDLTQMAKFLKVGEYYDEILPDGFESFHLNGREFIVDIGSLVSFEPAFTIFESWEEIEKAIRDCFNERFSDFDKGKGGYEHGEGYGGTSAVDNMLYYVAPKKDTP